MWRVPLVCLFAVAALAMPCGAKVFDNERVAALDYLETKVPEAGLLNANIVEALHANGVIATQWPSPEGPVTWRVIVPMGGANISVLRPLRALAFVHDERAEPDGSLTTNVLARFQADGYGDRRALNDDAYAILAVRAAGIASDDARVQAARAHLLANENDDGGWGWSIDAPSGTDMTGMVLEALLASGDVAPTVSANVSRFLDSARADGGGWSERPGGDANCESTVWGMRAASRIGMEVRDADWDFLLALQNPDGGFTHLPGGPSDVLCTTEAFSMLGDGAQGRVPVPREPAGPRGQPGLAVPALMLALAAVAALRPRLRHD